jgi:hypothetical protein
MSGSYITHNVFQPWTGTDGALTAAGGATETRTSEWFDTEGWTDRVVAWEVDSAGTIDFNVTMHISSQDSYVLNNKTCTTEDYVAVTIVDATTTAVYTRKDSDDVAELKIPVRSTRFVIENDQAQAVTGVTLWFEGWS